MPKIAAPSVAEHRLRQREALLRAATELLVTGGVSAVTPAAVGAAAGLSRPGVYQYFSSGADILAAVIEDAFPRANESLRTALDGVAGPERRLETYVRETLRLAAEGAHRPAAALAAAQLPVECLARLGELHREQAAPFLAALDELEVPELQLTARLLAGVIEAAMGAIDTGASLDLVTEHTLALVRFAVAPRP
ncbi:AcrR family transcriptional regulator [Cryobacterium sp. MP_M5]|uniref:TetR/AcrR family transcriptional regulator n=1 Tax=unclassified Cryobacterium TaxID=2649013 RepID=UPI0018CAF679|nr:MULTISPECIES: TetR/AcrR family transcriptional regulator [unclassified Cryobacterium]MBG6057883.1 AcrR family transcriptional regulator [Cryobacterium sp. MP_M3]MEC5176082.1 AcrR family transcriptional regulator [Cryobacterium sp. MP_M5]